MFCDIFFLLFKSYFYYFLLSFYHLHFIYFLIKLIIIAVLLLLTTVFTNKTISFMLTYLCACVCVYIYISFFSLLFIDFHSKSVWTDSIYLCNDTGNDDTGGSDIFMTLCIINLNSLHINPSCTRKRSLSCRHQWLVCPSIIRPTRNVFK